jgi:alkylated DNA nucleotide flippase Atl1
MLDPISIGAAVSLCSSAVAGVKKAIETGKQAHECGTELAKWAGAMSDINHVAHKHKTNDIPWWRKMSGSVEAEAIEAFAAQKQAQALRKELEEWISLYWGPSQLKELVRLEGEIRKQRKDQLYRRQEAIEKAVTMGVTFTIIIIGGSLLSGVVYLIGDARGKW